jgi:hypothetical protein
MAKKKKPDEPSKEAVEQPRTSPVENAGAVNSSDADHLAALSDSVGQFAAQRKILTSLGSIYGY